MNNFLASRRNGINGPSALRIDSFKQHLTDRGYSANTIACYVGGIAPFACWTRIRRLQVHRVDAETMRSSRRFQH